MWQTDDGELVNSEMRSHIEKIVQKMDIKNHTMDISAGSIKGDNYLGVIAKVVVKGKDRNGKDTTLNIIVKSAPQHEAIRKVTPIRGIFDREIYVYSKVFPEFIKFQEDKEISKPFKSFAKYYESSMDDGNEALIMENMKELGFALHDRHEALDYNHAKLVLREYGKLHALSYAMRDQQPELFQKLSDNMQEEFIKNMDKSEPYLKIVRGYSERALKSLDPIKHKLAYDKFNNYQDKITDIITDVMKETGGKYGVIRHGDCWMNNILFKYGDSKNSNLPTELCLLDWQLSHVGSPALDLAYFIFTCTDKELRDQHYDQLIKEYYNSLSTFLRELGSDPEEMLPFEVLQEHLKKFATFGLYMAIMVLHLMASEVDEIPDMQNMDFEDVEKSIDTFSYSSKNEEKYHARISGVILDFIKFDYDF